MEGTGDSSTLGPRGSVSTMAFPWEKGRRGRLWGRVLRGDEEQGRPEVTAVTQEEMLVAWMQVEMIGRGWIWDVFGR